MMLVCQMSAESLRPQNVTDMPATLIMGKMNFRVCRRRNI
jgi:hypothetical protein